jgi:hypothetical protein
MNRISKVFRGIVGQKSSEENFRPEYQSYVENVFVNKLDDYMLTHNHITLSIVDVTGLQTPVTLGETPVDPANTTVVGKFNAEQLLAAPFIPFAYSGTVSANDFIPETHLYIQDFNFKSIRAPTNNDPFRIGFQSGNMIINESYGFSFDNIISVVAVKANYVELETNTSEKGVTATRFIYRIDIHFSGWREDGTFEDKIQFSYPYTPDSTIRRNQFTMFAHVHTTQADINATGSSTVIDLVPYSEISSFPENALFPEMGSLVEFWKEEFDLEEPSETDAANVPSVKRTDTFLDDTRSRYPEIREARFTNQFSSVEKKSDNTNIRDNLVSRDDEKDVTFGRWIKAFTKYMNENVTGINFFDNTGRTEPVAADFADKLQKLDTIPRCVYEIHSPVDLLDEIIIKGSHAKEYVDALSIDNVTAPQDIIFKALINSQKVRDGLKQYPRILYMVRTQIDYGQAKYFPIVNDWVNIKVNFYIDQFEDYRYIPDNREDTLSDAFRRLIALVSTKSIKRVYHDDHFATNTEIINYNTKYNAFYYKNLNVDSSNTQLEYILNDLRRRDYVIFDKDEKIPPRGPSLGLTGQESEDFIKILFDGFQGYDNSPYIRSSYSMAKVDTDPVDTANITPHLLELLERLNSPAEGADQASIEADKNLAKFVQKSNPNSVQIEVSLRKAEKANYQKEYTNMMEYDLMTLDGFEVRGDPQWLFGMIPAMLYPDYDTKPIDHTRYTADVIMIKSISPQIKEYMATDRQYPVEPRYNVSGLYQIFEIEHKFQGGNYTQTMNGARLIGMDTKVNDQDRIK